MTGNAIVTRRNFIVASGAAAAAASLPLPGFAQAGRFAGRNAVAHTLTSSRDFLQEEVATWLSRTTGANLTLVPMLESQAYARMQAEAADPQIDMFVSLSQNERDAKSKGLSRPLTFHEQAKKLPDNFRDPEGYWVVWAVIAEGILYRTDKIKTPPTSYEDFFKPEYKGHVAFPTIQNFYGLDFLVMLARLRGGGEHNIDPGFAAIKKLKEDGATLFRGNPAQVQQNFAQNDIWIMPYDSGNAYMAQQVGLPIGFSIPSHGAAIVMCTAFIAAKSKNVDVISAGIDRLLHPEVQSRLATKLGWAPANPEAVLPDNVKAFNPRPDQIVTLDRGLIASQRSAWTERYQREIGG